MPRKSLHGVQNANERPIRVTIGSIEVKEVQIIDPIGIHTDSSGGNSHTRAAMSEFIRKCEPGEIEIKPIQL